MGAVDTQAGVVGLAMEDVLIRAADDLVRIAVATAAIPAAVAAPSVAAAMVTGSFDPDRRNQIVPAFVVQVLHIVIDARPSNLLSW